MTSMDTDMSVHNAEEEAADADVSRNAEALSDILSLFTEPVLYSVNRTKILNKLVPQASDPLSAAFLSASQKLKAQSEELTPRSKVMLVPQLMALLKECLASHRWTGVVEVLRVLGLETRNTSVTLWKVGFEVLMSDKDGSSGLMLQLVNQLRNLKDIEAKEVTLEYVKYVLCQGRLEDTAQVFEMANVSAKRQRTLLRKTEAELELKAYQGLCWYVEWLRRKHQLDQLQEQYEEDDYFISHSSAQSRMTEEDLMRRHAEKALAAFGSLKDSAVVMDMFIMKYVELLQYYEEFEEAEVALKSYATKHPDNPNTQRYLYWFYKRWRPDSEEMMSALKLYIQAVPSDCLALELCQLQQSKGASPAELLPALFNMLDYPTWKDKEKPWQTLLSLITDIYSRADNDGVSVIQQCWDNRSSWWPNYHFLPDSVDLELKKGVPDALLTFKGGLAVFLLGSGNTFSEMVSATVAASEPVIKQAESLLRELDVT